MKKEELLQNSHCSKEHIVALMKRCPAIKVTCGKSRIIITVYVLRRFYVRVAAAQFSQRTILRKVEVLLLKHLLVLGLGVRHDLLKEQMQAAWL